MADKLRGGTTIGGNLAWHAGNMGAGSGLDSDLLDGKEGSYYATAASVAALAALDPVITLNGDVSGSGTMTNLGNTTITTVVANDSHTHTNSTISGIVTATANTVVQRDGNGYIYANGFNSTLADTASVASHYLVETGSDGWIRPKTLANVRSEIVTTAAVNSVALTSTGTVTSGTWSAGFGAISGANLTSLNASNLSSGTVPDARISGSYTGMTNLTGSGTVDFSKFLGNASDTVAAPSFSWTGDLDTGIYRPAADQLAITTGGVQRALFSSSGITGTLVGNASTATKLSTTRSNYKGTTDSVVVGELMWKQYGNNHTIFDASNSTTPTGVTKSNINPDVRWSATHPTLMGYNGTSTYGVRVDSSRYADQLATARTIALSGGATGTATSFDGTGNISIPVTGLNASNLNSGTVPDARLSGIYSGMSLRLNGNNTVFTTESSGSANTSRTVYGLAEYKNNSASTKGAIVFIAPNTSNTIMHQLEVSGLLYNQNIVSLIVQGYRTTGAWSDLRKISTGTVDIQVRWGVTPDGKNCLILGDVGTVWSYPHIAITRAMFSHDGINDAYCTGWTVALVTSFTGYSNISATIGDSTMIGNVSSATKLATARTIGGVSFDGTANINLPGVNTAGNQNTTGNAGSATKLATARTITLSGDVSGSTSFDGSGNVTLSAQVIDNSHNHTNLSGTVVFSGSTGNAYNNSNIIVNGNGTANTIKPSISFHQPGLYAGTLSMENGTTFQFKNQAGAPAILANSITGNAETATKLQTARTINGTSFDGTANITTANWGTARTITIGATGKSVNGSGNVSWAHTDIGVIADTANTLALRDGSGDMTARLFRSTFGNETAVSGTAAVMMRVNNSNDNYNRAVTAAGFKGWMQANNLHIDAYEHSKYLVDNGYMRFTNGLIIQWGRATTGANGYADVGFPIVFPTAVVYLNSIHFGTDIAPTSNMVIDRNWFRILVKNQQGVGLHGWIFHWMAIGW